MRLISKEQARDIVKHIITDSGMFLNGLVKFSNIANEIEYKDINVKVWFDADFVS